MSTAASIASPFARRLVGRAGLVLVFLTGLACANSDKSATPGPDNPAAATPETKPEAKVAEVKPTDKPADKPAEEKPVAEKPAEEKPAAEKPAGDKAAEDKALVKGSDAKAAETDKGDAKAKAPGDAPQEKAAEPSKSAVAKATKIESKTGILAKGEADKYVKSGGRPVVRLLDPGSEPRVATSYAISKGAAKPLQMGMDLEMAMEAGGMKLPPTKMPRMLLVFNFNAGDRAGTEWPIDGKLSKISVESNGGPQDQIATALRPQLGQLEGIGVNYFVDEKGRIRDVKVTIPESLPAMAGQMMSGMTQSVESMISPLPTEAIGVGAKWEVLARLMANGADILQVSTYTLEKRDGNVLSLDSVVKQFAAKDVVNPPGMPPGASARLLSYKSVGGGKPVFEMSDIAPKSGSMTLNSSMAIELKMTVDGKTEKQSTSVDAKMTALYSRPAP